MIFLRECNLLFLKPIKVAGTSFEISLSKFGMKHDIITPISPADEKIRATLGFAGPQNFRKPLWEWDAKDLYMTIRQRSSPIKYFNHISAAEARTNLGSQIFDQAFKISIVRNPYDMLASLYFWEMKRRKNKLTFLDWAQKNPRMFNINDRHYSIDGKNIIDFFILSHFL